jgi:hypothetical protein
MSLTTYQCVSPAQKAAKIAFESLIADQTRADAAYDALPGANNGRVISTDLVRELDSAYANWKEGNPLRDLAPSWDKAWLYAQTRFVRELSRLKRGNLIRFMAGGWAAGKTRVVKFKIERGDLPAELTWDGTLKDTVWARDQIREALGRNCRVEILYVHRNIELAMYGAIDRARKEGRSVPIRELPSNHRAVQRSVRRLITDFGMNRDVSFTFYHNIGSEKLSLAPMPFEEDELAPTGALHYRKSHEGYYCEATSSIEAACR